MTPTTAIAMQNNATMNNIGIKKPPNRQPKPTVGIHDNIPNTRQTMPSNTHTISAPLLVQKSP